MTDHNLTPEIFGDFGLHLENMKRKKTMGYNGWNNRATWLLSVNGFCELYEDRLSDFDSVHDLAETMHEEFEADLEESITSIFQRGMIFDLISCAHIDFDELARSIWIEEESE